MNKTRHKTTHLLLTLLFLAAQLMPLFSSSAAMAMPVVNIAASATTFSPAPAPVPMALSISKLADADMQGCHDTSNNGCEQHHCAGCSVIISAEPSVPALTVSIVLSQSSLSGVPQQFLSGFYRPPQNA